MSFSDRRFSYGPFPPHWVPRQYIANYFSEHRTDRFLVLNTTVEDLSRLSDSRGKDRWRLILRQYDAVKHVDLWWEEEFDAVIIANGHYSVPFVSISCPCEFHPGADKWPKGAAGQRVGRLYATISRPCCALQDISQPTDMAE